MACTSLPAAARPIQISGPADAGAGGARGVRLLRVAVVACAYFAAAKAGLALAFGTEQVTAVWPPTGIALAALLVWGRGMWPGVAAGAFLANVTANEPLLSAAGIMVGNTLEAVIGAWLLTRAAGFRIALDRRGDVVRLVLFAAVASTLVSATIGVLSLWAGGLLTTFAWPVWKTWWLGDMTGALIVAPALLVLASRGGGWGDWRRERRRLAEGAAALAGLAALAAAVFSRDAALAYLVFPVLFWTSARLRQPGAAASSLLLSVIAVWFTAEGHGPFVGGSPDEDLLQAQVYVAVVTLAALLIAAVVCEKERAEDRLVLSEQAAAELGQLLESAPDAFVIVDEHGLIRIVNAQTTTLFGYTPDELVGEPVELLIPEQLRAGHVHRRDRYQERPVTRPMGADLELAARHKDGHEFPVEISLSPVQRHAGRLVSASVRDITQRKRQQEELRLAEERFRGAFEHAPIGMALVAPDGRWLRVNRALCEIVGYPEGELLALTFQDITHPEDVDADLEQARRLLAGEIRAYTMEKRYHARDGRLIWVRLSVSLVRDGDGEPLHFISQIQDVTQEKRAEASLREAQARLRAIFDHVPAALSLRGLDGRYLHVNQFLAHALGDTPERLVGREPGEFVDGETAELMRREDDEMRRSGRRFVEEMTVPGPDGAGRDYHVVRYPVLDADGTVTAFGSFALDITDRRRAERAREEALAALEEAQRTAGVGSWSWNPAADEATWSAEMYRIFARDPAQGPAASEQFVAYVHPDDRARLAAGYAETFGGGPSFELDYRITDGAGRERTLHALGRRDPDRLGRYVGTVQDVTSLRAAEHALREAEERFRNAFEHAPIGMALTDLDGRVLQANQALCEITGYADDELRATSFAAITHPDDLDAARQQAIGLLGGGLEHVHHEKRYLRASGEPVWVSEHATLLRDRDGTPQRFLRQIVDITERRKLESELRHLADHDPLTGLRNRRGLEVELDRHVAHVDRYGDRGALLVLDLDHFKTVNDTLGHSAGDQLIVSVAGLLRRRLRASDTIARLGGDEFAVLLPEADLTAARGVAEAIVADIRDNAVTIDGRPTRRITASVGIAPFTRGLASGEEVLVNADLAMYDAKEAGRDGVGVFTTEFHQQPRMKGRLAWIERIRGALDEERFALYAQPIVALSSGEVHQYELLLRMVDDNGDAIPPGAFIYVAERYDLIQELDRWVATQAIRLIERERAAGRELALEVNLSGKSLGEEALLALVERELDRSGIDPGALIFEVTETAAVANIQLAGRFAERLTALGCRFALDDFGAGFGSFYYLKHLPFDYLKIDGEFVTRCTSNRTDQLVIESLVAIATGLGKQTIAECVEHESTERFLRGRGVDYAQGYHIGRPAPVAEVLAAAHRAAR